MSAKFETKIKTIKHIDSNLEKLQSNEEDYHKKIWRERKKLIQNWFEVEREDENIINEITQKEDYDHISSQETDEDE